MPFHLGHLPLYYSVLLAHQGHASSCCRHLATSQNSYSAAVVIFMILVLLPSLGVFPSKDSCWFFLFAHALIEGSVLQSSLDLQRKHQAAFDSTFLSIWKAVKSSCLGLLLLSVIPSSQILENSTRGVQEPISRSSGEPILCHGNGVRLAT